MAEDLKSLGLLDNNPIAGKPNLALGYDPGFLPSFELPPSELTDLRILHGSCRRINRDMEDGLSWVDDRIREGRSGLPDPANSSKPHKRPHQLLMTGDQIYADDVPLPLLPQLIEREVPDYWIPLLPTRVGDGFRLRRGEVLKLDGKGGMHRR